LERTAEHDRGLVIEEARRGIWMKIRDLLVIVFTAIVALLLFLRHARADGSCPEGGAGRSCSSDGTSCPESTSSTGADRGRWGSSRTAAAAEAAPA
jgi:hypothetical protein